MLEKSLNNNLSDDERALALRFEEIGEQIRRAAGGRAVRMLAATKTVSADRINFAIDHLGLDLIGENRVQELLEKYDSLHRENLEIHFIGRLQTNKVKYIVDKVDMIESVDSLKLAEEISKRSLKIGKVMDVLIEVNVGSEESKGGIDAAQLSDFWDAVAALEGVRVCGIMVIPPRCGENEDSKKYFLESFQIFLDIREKKHHNIRRPLILSMGMSDTFVPAIECGSDQVRLGSALFGNRIYLK